MLQARSKQHGVLTKQGEYFREDIMDFEHHYKSQYTEYKILRLHLEFSERNRV